MVKPERGQAAIETILLVSVLITFVAAAYQIFLVNRTVFWSLTAVHKTVFENAFERNCPESRDDDGCEYSQDSLAEGHGGVATEIVWSPDKFPEVRIPILGMFRKRGLGGGGLYLSSNRPGSVAGGALCPDLPCKRTRVGAGTYKGLLDGVWLLRKTSVDAEALMKYVEWAAFTRIISVIQ